MDSNFLTLKDERPEDAAAVHGVIIQSVKQAKQENPSDDDAAEKRALTLAYEGLDLLLGFPGPVDYIVKDLVIPMLPGLIKWAMEELSNLMAGNDEQ